MCVCKYAYSYIILTSLMIGPSGEAPPVSPSAATRQGDTMAEESVEDQLSNAMLCWCPRVLLHRPGSLPPTLPLLLPAPGAWLVSSSRPTRRSDDVGAS